MDQKNKNFTEEQEFIAQICNALRNPIRVAIIELLSKKECCYHGDLSEGLPIAPSTLSQHLNILKNAGLLIGKADHPKVKYCVNKEKWDLAKKLLNELFKK